MVHQNKRKHLDSSNGGLIFFFIYGFNSFSKLNVLYRRRGDESLFFIFESTATIGEDFFDSFFFVEKSINNDDAPLSFMFLKRWCFSHPSFIDLDAWDVEDGFEFMLRKWSETWLAQFEIIFGWNWSFEHGTWLEGSIVVLWWARTRKNSIDSAHVLILTKKMKFRFCLINSYTKLWK